MIPSAIEKKHLELALNEIDQKGVPQDLVSTRYHLIYNGKRYPPKYALGLAAKFATGNELDPSQFSGGSETKRF